MTLTFESDFADFSSGGVLWQIRRVYESVDIC